MIARDGLTEDADAIDDCNGEDLGALIDVVGDDDYEHSVSIDFEVERLRKAASALLSALQAASDWIDAQVFVPRTGIQATIQVAIAKVTNGQVERRLSIDFEAERLRKAASALLAALEAVLPYAENEYTSLYECWKRDGQAALKEESAACEIAIEQARHAIAKATADQAERRPS
jgi:hypothetical protein